MLEVGLTLVIAAAGGWLASLAGLPAAWLLGATLAVTVAGFLKLPVLVTKAVQNPALALVGLAMGSRITGDTLALVVEWPLSFLVLLLAIVVSMWLCMAYLERVCGFDRATSLLSSSPGGMVVVASFAAEGHGHMARILVIQSLRLLFLTAVVPLTLTTAAAADPSAEPPLTMALGVMLALAALGFGLGLVLQRLRVPSPMLLGGLAVGGLTHATDLVHGTVPDAAAAVAFLVIGSVIGARFRRLTLADVRGLLIPSLVVTAIASVVSGSAALAVAILLDQPFGQVWVAYAPGGVEAMAAIALEFDFEATYVAAHHVMRIVVISLALGFLLQWTSRRS
ncbi:MAG: AbrB family transcriptional regulator [Pseudomonadota bacterium]